jgi:hypothetical protein
VRALRKRALHAAFDLLHEVVLALGVNGEEPVQLRVRRRLKNTQSVETYGPVDARRC